MKVKTYFRLALVLAAATAVPAMAAEDKYPAQDFKPSVIYSNPELIAKSGTATGAVETQHADPKYPAAYFSPTVIQSSVPKQAQADTHQPDPKYPAAYFNPTVITTSH